jgi:hypothetical protein
MSDKEKSGGVSLLGMVFLVFLILKLANVGAVANWSWWWVFSPLWIPVVVGLLIVALIQLFD